MTVDSDVDGGGGGVRDMLPRTQRGLLETYLASMNLAYALLDEQLYICSSSL